MIAHNKEKIGTTSRQKRKHVEHKGLDDPSSFRKTVGLPNKEGKYSSSSSREYHCPILEEKPKDVDSLRNFK